MDPVKAIFYVANLLALCAMHYACPVKLPLGKRLSRFNWGSLRHALKALIIYKIIVKSYIYLCHIYVTQGAELSIRYALCPTRLALQ